MSAARVSGTEIDGVNHEFELWSSMGNGYTFELETLIFWALARAVCYFSGIKGEITVYGDDVILPSLAAKRYMRIARWFGFIPNEAKSFVEGYFRESCGKFYYRGRDISPFFLRGKISTYRDLIGVLNQVLEWNCRGYGFFIDESIHRWWKRWSSLVPAYLRGGVDPMDPTVLVDGSNCAQLHITTISEALRVIDNEGLSHPSSYLLALATGGEYSLATKDIGRLKLTAFYPFGTSSYTPHLIFE
jgi:hypothetical protein